jgi:hypothetical protein
LLLKNNVPFLLENNMKNTRKLLLITTATAALLAVAGLASAQGMNNQTPTSPAPTAQAPMKENSAPTALAPTKEKPAAPTAQGPMKEKPAPTAQTPTKDKPAVTAQAPGVAKPETTGQGGVTPMSGPPTPRAAPPSARDETKSAPPAALSAEQHAKVWDTLRAEKTERLTNVHFSTRVGEVVPGTVHLYSLPVSIVEYAPQYRDYDYVQVGDEILIVDPHTLRIVAVIAA